jgi:2-oxoglutarate ferredoxin oxidoreductase subunit beta
MSTANGHATTGAAGNGAAGAPVTLGRKDFMSDQEMRWCPGCGDYGITAALQLLLPELGVQPHELVFVSGIGCAARLPYYMNTYGIHSIHGRAPAVATGVAMTRPDLSVWVIGGDGDMLSIGANHLLHALRRNVDLKIVMFNNQIYGLTKGQYSPTSEIGKITKSTPFGSIDQPFNPVSVALGAEATFVARTHEADRGHMQEVFRRAYEHKGAAFVEVYQNCNVFNDGAFDDIMAKGNRASMLIPLRHGEPIRFGADGELGVFQNEYAELYVDRIDAHDGDGQLVVHDEHRPDPTLAFALSRLASGPHTPTPIGVFRDVDRPLYELEVAAQVDEAIERQGRGDLAELIRSGATWTVT